MSAGAWKTGPGTWMACTRPMCASRQNRWIGLLIRSRVAAGAADDLIHRQYGPPGGLRLDAPADGPLLERHGHPGLRRSWNRQMFSISAYAGGVDLGGGLADGVQHVRVVPDRVPVSCTRSFW